MDFENMMAVADGARVSELEALITQARHDYYNATAKVSDDVYDAWVDELTGLKADSPAVTAIGAKPVSEWKKVAHGIPMGSLNKVNTVEELRDWYISVAGSIPVVDMEDLIPVEPINFEPLLVTEKLDGISIHVRYENGKFTQALTRGDGTIGEDITPNVQKMKGYPTELPGFNGSLRGEIILTKSAHQKHFPDKANPRNAAAGISKRYDSKGCEHLTVLFYHVAEGREFDKEHEVFEWLRKMGFATPYWEVPHDTVDPTNGPTRLWDEYQKTKRLALDYDIDGLVVRIDNLAKQLALGEKDGRPKGAVAFKFASATAETPGNDVLWSVGGTGVITPVAVLEPVRILGTEIARASLYNVKYMKQIGYAPGCKVLVARANDVIPRVLSVTVPSARSLEIPSLCPSCDHPLSMDGEYLVCTNSAECPAQTVGRLKRYVKELEILEWGETLIEKLVEAGLVKGVPDLYRLKLIDLASIERMGEKSAENVLKTLWAKNPLPLDKLLGALSIPLCGSTTIAAVMGAGFDTWDKIVRGGEDLQKVPSVGPVKGGNLFKWCRTIGHRLVPELFEVGVKIKERRRGVLTGQSFCFTGKSVKSRADLEELVAEHGGTVKASVTKGLIYLVMANPNSNTTKAQAARKNGTKCISEEDFIKMVTP